MSELADKERRAIKILRMYKGDEPIEVSYSGGKDSDVILALTKEAGIPYRVIYKNTTIDPPYTIKHCKDNGVEIMRPTMSFFDIVRKKGFPTRRTRFCCEVLKEYKILDNAVQGIRKCESTARAKRYKEPVICRMYNKHDHVNVFLPILDWSDGDVKDFIEAHGIQCHPLYYDEQGKFNVKERLGCIGCPMASDNGLSDFMRYPKMVKAWCDAEKKWLATPRKRTKGEGCRNKFPDAYAIFAHNIFFRDYNTFQAASTSLFGKEDWKQRLEDFFKIEL